jgi:PAS domain S-box-containing protein
MSSIGTEVLTGYLYGLHATALLLTTLSCLGVAVVAFLFHRRLRGAVDDFREVAWLAFMLFVLLVLDGAVNLTGVLAGSGLAVELANIGLSVLAALCGVAICIKLPKVSIAPLSKEMLATNAQLVSERKARNDVVETLTRLNNELEQRVLSRTQQLEEANRRFESALAGTNITVIEQDRDLRYTWIHNPPAGFAADMAIHRRPEEVLPKNAAEVDLIAKSRVLETGTAEIVEVSVELDGETRWYEERLEPVVRDGAITGVVTVAIDISSHKRYEQHLHRLLREITHRSKNLLAVVQGIARQTAESVDTPQEFIMRFGARLQALSGAHDLLVRQAWQGVELRDLIMRELESLLPKMDFRVGISGESEILGVEVAQNLALGLHEMATNAIAHGALSGSTGRVDISWHRVKQAERDLVELTWIESGGPPVIEPVARGFGRALIERLVPRAIEGDSEIAFDASGLRWTLRFPVERHSEVA